MIPPSGFGRRTGIVWIDLLAWVVITCFLILGCGGGGGSGTSPGSVTYSGLTTPVEITADNANAIAANVLETESTTGGFISISSLGDTGLTAEASYQPYLLGVSQAVKGAMTLIDYDSAASRDTSSAIQTIDDLIYGTCGGNASYTVQVDTDTGAFSGQMAFNGFCEKGISISGPATFSGTANLNISEFDSFTLTFDYVTATSQTESYTIDGRINCIQSGTTDIATLDMVVRDNHLDRTSKVEDYQIVITDGYGQTELEISGRIYDPDHGYVDLETESVLIINDADEYPGSGTVTLTGALGAAGGATRVRLTALSPTQCQVEADTNGDGTFDYDTGPMLWTELDNSA
jgi:hypothetical protein